MGSVKDLEVLIKPSKDGMGVARFHFSDRYSVFDWGEMPDHIKGKGAALCIMGAYCFERLKERGVETHYRGIVTSEGKLVSTDELKKPTNIMEINLVRVFKPEFKDGRYDYNIFRSLAEKHEGNFLLPIEVIYRNSLPEGSSIFRRLERGEISFKDLGLNHHPKPGEKLPNPIFDVSTKLEEKDRYISWDEAKKISGLSDEEVEEAKNYLSKVNSLITELTKKSGLENEDGKVEFAFNPKRKLMIVDVVGTLDECRFTFKGLHVSKEIARQFYKKTSWYKDIEEAKKEAEVRGVKDWRSLCKSKPPKLDKKLGNIISKMYMAAANELTNLNLFDVPKLRDIIEEYKRYIEETKI